MRKRLLLLIPGLLFLVGIVAFEFGVRMGEKKGRRPASPAPALQDDQVLIETLLAQNLDERRFPFSAVVHASSGHALTPIDQDGVAAAAIVAAVEAAANEVLALFNAAESPVRGLRRINEASRFFEDALRAALDRHAELSCRIPRTVAGSEQRSGYPDLRIEHLASGTIAYLDPKLFEASSRGSSLRTFYFTPRRESSKIGMDAHHLLLGIAHDGKDGAWTFTGWELIDLAQLEVRLKAEFQASNRDLYREGAVLSKSP